MYKNILFSCNIDQLWSIIIENYFEITQSEHKAKTKFDLKIKHFTFAWHFVENMIKDFQKDDWSHYVLCSQFVHRLNIYFRINSLLVIVLEILIGFERQKYGEKILLYQSHLYLFLKCNISEYIILLHIWPIVEYYYMKIGLHSIGS